MSTTEAARAANRARFARLVARPDADIDLALGALCIAADGRPDLEFAPTIEALDRLAERVRIRVDRDSRDIVIDRLHDVLYREFGFRSPAALEYRDPRLSHLDQVIDRRVGLPITLSIVELEVGWRLGLPLFGIGLPGHFIVGAPGGVLIDPANAGRRLAPDDCQDLIRESLGSRFRFHSGMLRAVGKRSILARTLRNLRSVYLAKRDWPAALGVVELLTVIEPTEPDHGRDKGLLLGRMGRFTDAVGYLANYLDERPDGADIDDVRQVIGIFKGRRN